MLCYLCINQAILSPRSLKSFHISPREPLSIWRRKEILQQLPFLLEYYQIMEFHVEDPPTSLVILISMHYRFDQYARVDDCSFFSHCPRLYILVIL